MIDDQLGIKVIAETETEDTLFLCVLQIKKEQL